TPSFGGFFDLGGNPASITGDFRVIDTGFGAFAYNFTGGNNTLTIGGDLDISGGFFAYTYGLGGSGTLNINTSLTAGKGLKISGGYTQLADDDDLTINCNGVVEIGGDVELGASTASTELNVTGDFTHSSGSLLSSSGTNTIRFNGISQQIYTSTITPIGNLNYNVATNAILSIPGSNFISGGGSFTLSGNGTLQVGSNDATGALQTGAIGGNIRVTGSRTYSSPSTIVYNGTAAQFIGNGHPTVTGINTTVDNSNGVSLIVGVPAIITTNLTLADGNLNIGNGSLTLNGTLTPGGNNITVGNTGSIIINGSATLGSFPFPVGTQSFSNFTLNNPSGITFSNDVTITGVLTLTDGSLIFNDRTLRLNGTLSVGSGGDLSSNSASTLIIGGTGSLGSSLNFSGSGNTLGTLTMSRASSGTADVNSTVTISSNLNLSNGELVNTNGLTMANGATITRSGGTLTNDRPDVPSGAYNVVYNPGISINTGMELPGPADLTQLNNLTISGPTVLTQNLTVNGNVTLSSSTFTCGTNTITMIGSTWTRSGGSFIPGTGQVTFDGVTSIVASSGTPQFGNFRVNSGRTLNFPASTVAISGNPTFLAGATINPNGGTILLNGSGLQTLLGGGATLNNVTVSKSGGSIDLTSALNITGLLNITTATVFASSGNLTLLSTSDGVTGNASIGDLSSGGSVTGDVIVQRFMSAEARVWRYLSSPIQNATVASWKDDFPVTGSFTDPSTAGEWPVFSPALKSNVISIYRYNETTVGTRDLGWEAFPAAGLASANPLEVGRGYSAFVRNTASTVIDVTGPINSGDVNLPVTLTGTGGVNNDNGWNIVGNPYPSSIDWDSPNWTKTNISGVVQIRDDPSGIFQTWNGSIGSMGSGRIATGQAFWVQAIGSPTLTARESVKTNTTGTFYKQDTQVPDAFEIILSKGLDKDFAYLWFKNDATENVDVAYDAVKFNNDIFDFSILMANGDKLAISTIPYLTCGSELKLDLSTSNTEFDMNGSYTMEFGELGTIDPSLQLQLFDAFTNSTLDVSDGATYSFQVTDDLASFGSERFKLTLLAGPASFDVGEVTSSTSCKPGSVVLVASGAPTGGLYKWYESETAGASLLESSSSEFTTPELDKSKTYYVSVVNELGCESTRKAIQAVVINFDDVVISEIENELTSNYVEGNQWYRDDILIPGAITQNYKPEESGLYKVEVNVGSCMTSAERAVTITGLEDEAFFEGFVKIFPNPVSRELTIRVKQRNSGSPRIIDLNGREIGKLDMDKENDGWIGNFDFSGQPEGMYILQVADNNGQVFNKRIVKK
ncbi:MAG: T9SS type A sorting domain-containing protein, partial [Cyclobacteriaceae bacterium]|nr:T9SS type A sorting domain-containing protein [Cyclobacteriaceae bacterium]